MFCSPNLGGGLECCSLFKGGYMSFKEFLGGVRVLRPLAANLRDPPPLGGFLTPSLRKSIGLKKIQSQKNMGLGKF